MSRNNPRMRSLAEKYWPQVSGLLLEKKATVSERALTMKTIADNLKKSGSEDDLVFVDHYPYSFQLDTMMNIYVASGRVADHGDVFWLTDYGSSICDK